MRLPRPGSLLGGWAEDPLWAPFYDWTVEHPTPGRLLWRAGVGSDLDRLYDAAAEIGRLPAGSRVLDVPSGGGVALRGLTPGQGVDHVACDIAPAMLERAARAARRHRVADQVRTVVADVGALPFEDGEFDLVVSFTGLHCFPDPRGAVREMVRVLRPGGVLTGSALMRDTGLRYEPMRVVGRASGLLGPSCTRADLERWLAEDGVPAVTVDRSGAIAYFRGEKRPA